jgi:hypothetical protein
MSLSTNLRIFFPNSPNPHSQEILNISNALGVAIAATITTSLVPAIGTIFLSSLPSPTPLMTSLGLYLDTTVSPVISSALSVQASTGVPSLAAWQTVSSTLNLIPAPPFFAGVDGSNFWQAIIQTLMVAIPT